METVNWGIIGCGEVCEQKAGPALAGVEGSRLAAVMRRTPHLAEDFARRHEVPRFYTTIDDILADPAVNAIYVATPNGVHEKPALAAAEAGKHVLVEKDMAANADACTRMIGRCREKGVVLAVAYYRRCYPAVMRMKELLDQGTIGTPRRIAIADRFPLSHQLDLVHYLCGDISTVWAREESLPPDSHAESGGMLYLRTVSGVTGALCIDYRWRQPQTVSVEGDGGTLTVEDIMGGVLRIAAGATERREHFGRLPCTHWGLVRNFVDHLSGRSPLACDGVEGRKSQVLLDIVDTLTRDGTEQSVDYR
jgi:predicted dehydrogenase